MVDKHHAILDASGEESPIPVIRTKESLDQLAAGEILKVVTDKQSAIDNIQTLVSNNPFKILKQDKEETNFVVYIEKE